MIDDLIQVSPASDNNKISRYSSDTVKKGLQLAKKISESEKREDKEYSELASEIQSIIKDLSELLEYFKDIDMIFEEIKNYINGDWNTNNLGDFVAKVGYYARKINQYKHYLKKNNIDTTKYCLNDDLHACQDLSRTFIELNKLIEELKIAFIELNKIIDKTKNYLEKNWSVEDICQKIGRAVLENKLDFEYFIEQVKIVMKDFGLGEVEISQSQTIIQLTEIYKALPEYIQTIQKDLDNTANLNEKILEGKFDFNDFLKQMQMLKNMGSIGGLMKMIPEMGKLSDSQLKQGEDNLKKAKVMIQSMTQEERANPDLLAKTPSRRRRIARGCGYSEVDVGKLIGKFMRMRLMMRQMVMGNYPINRDEMPNRQTTKKKKRYGIL